MILLCYDGSSDAQAAIDRAGELLSGQSATVLTVWEPFIDPVWEPFIDLMTRSGASLALPPLDSAEIDAVSEQAARERAEEGAERARRAGLNAQPRTRAHSTVIVVPSPEVAAERAGRR